MPDRYKQLEQWLDIACGLQNYRLTSASGDASFRRYFRVHLEDGEKLIAMDAPPEKEDCRPFIDVAQRLAVAEMHVPQIQAHDLQQGFMLLEDLGDKLYLPELDNSSVDLLYAEALTALLEMQLYAPKDGLAIYDEAVLRREMSLFPDWLLQKHLGLEFEAETVDLLDEAFQLLISCALEQPQVLVHRDYHSRNLLVCHAASPGVIDFQDALIGPITYDLVSLLRDCYIRWPLQQVDDWALGYRRQAMDRGLLTDCSEQRFLRWFDLMGAQRHLKAAGIFARLKQRDGKSGYLADIPRTLGYIVEVAGRRPELNGLAELIERQVLPRL